MGKSKSDYKCSICGKEFIGWGNNAYPVNDGRCCDECNFKVVIPRRFIDLKNKRSECCF